MKLTKIILTGVLATALTGISFATNTVKDSTLIVLANEEKAPKEIKVSELPEAVLEALKGESYSGWEAQKAWIVLKEDEEVYQVEVQKGAERTVLFFDEEGSAIG